MRIVGDVLLFVTTSLVLSVTILLVIIRLQTKGERFRLFLPIMVPLTLQLGIVTLASYLERILPAKTLAGEVYGSLSLLFAIASIVLISLILYSVGQYIMRIAADYFDPWAHRVGTWVMLPLAILFVVVSLFGVLYLTEGDWSSAVSLTLKYYSSWGIFLLVPHVISAAVLLSRVTDRETQNHLRGILYAFAPVPIVFPLDLIYLGDHYFKLAYVSFAAFSVIVYWHISKRFIRDYYTVPQAIDDDAVFGRYDVSPRELEIARLLVIGKTNAEIGKELFISENTVRSHIKSIYRKMDVANRVQLIHKIRADGS